MIRTTAMRTSLAALAAALGLGVAAASAGIDPALQERAAALGFEAQEWEALDPGHLAEITALFEADHDDEALRREIGAILERAGEEADAG